jgi:hypothetical protein
MKFFPKAAPLCLLVFSAFLCAYGQTVRTWNGSTAFWGTSSNWIDNGIIRNSRLVWNGSGQALSNNNTNTSIDSVRRLTFSGTTSYTITGNRIRLVDIASSSHAMILNESNVLQTIEPEVFFDDINRLGYIGNRGIGPLMLSGGITLGGNISAFRMAGDIVAGTITVSGKIIGSKPISIGFTELNEFKPNSRIIFSGDNSAFTGTIIVQNGILSLRSNTATGISTENLVEVVSGAALELRGGITLAGKNISLNGQGFSNGGAITNQEGINTVVSDIILANNVRMEAANGTTLRLNNIIRPGVQKWNVLLNCNGATSNILLNGSSGILEQGQLGDLTKTGTGILSISGPTGFTNIFLNGGTLNLINSDRINTDCNFFLNGGTLITGNGSFNQQFGRLNMSFTSVNNSINLGTGNPVLKFANSRDALWNPASRINIRGWSGADGSAGTSGKIFIEPLDEFTPGLTEAQLSQIQFENRCLGATILPSGELVPSKLPFISNITCSPTLSGIAFSAYTGSQITITGCKFTGATKLKIGDIEFFPPFAANTSTSITLANLPDNVSGLVEVTVPDGSRTFTSPITNLGYITHDQNTVRDWMASVTQWTWRGSTGLTNIPPPANRSVTIAHRPLFLVTQANDVNTGLPPDNTLTIAALPGAGTNPALLIGALNVLQSNTPIVLGNRGVLKTYNGHDNGSNLNPGLLPGFNTTLGTLKIANNTSIALGTSLHDLRFAASDTVEWTPNTILTIFNWKGTLGNTGTEGRIFFGSNTSGLSAAQLSQIRFDGICAKAMLRANGELVPSNVGLITEAEGNPGGLNGAYIGSNIAINGCNLKVGTVIRIGGVEVPSADITFETANLITFKYVEGYPNDTIRLFEGGVETEKGKNPLINLGYTTKENGAWNMDAIWLNGTVPTGGKRINIQNEIDITGDIINDDSIKALIVLNGGKLSWAPNTILQVSNYFENTGTIITANGSVLEFLDSTIVLNKGSFDSEGKGTTIFRNGGIIQGTIATGFKPIIFNDVELHAKNFLIPAQNSGIVPLITNNFRISGGRVWSITTNPYSGPRYANGSNLIYGGVPDREHIRGTEWMSNDISNDDLPGFPYNIIIENGITVTLKPQAPNPTPTNLSPAVLTIRNNLIIKKGRLNQEHTWRSKIRGNLEIGENGESFYRLGNSDTNSRVIINGNLVIHPDSKFLYEGGGTPTINRWIVFSGGTSSTISTPGQPIVPGIPNLSLRRVIIDKQGNEVTLEVPVSILNELILTNGIVNSSLDNYLEINESAIITGGRNSSFINGPLRKITASSPASASGPFEFKVGKKLFDNSLLYRPVWIDSLVHDANTVYTAEFFNVKTNNNPPDFPFSTLVQATGVFDSQLWKVDKSGNGAARVGIPYAPNPFGGWYISGPQSSDNVAVVRYVDTVDKEDWRFTKDPQNFNNTTAMFPEVRGAFQTGMVYSDLLNDFSLFSIGFNKNTILPIHLLSFTANPQGSDALLQWNIADANDLKHFEVEHSTDGQNYAVIGSVQSSENKEYQYRHANLAPGAHYYRLGMVEKDGTKGYSRVELVQMGAQRTIITGLLQNPVQGSEAIVRLQSAAAQNSDVTVFDLSGKMMLRQEIGLQAGSNQARVSLYMLPKGQYFLKMRTADGVEKIMPLLK